MTKVIWQKEESLSLLYLPVGSIGLTVLLQFASFGCRWSTPKFPLPLEAGTPISYNVIGPHKCTAKYHLNPSNGLSTNVTDRRHTDRQTDCATEKCVGVVGIACAARAIPR